jgi:hypothetical protein
MPARCFQFEIPLTGLSRFATDVALTEDWLALLGKLRAYIAA